MKIKTKGFYPSKNCDYIVDPDVSLTFENYETNREQLIYWIIKNENRKLVEIKVDIEKKTFHEIIVLDPVNEFLDQDYFLEETSNVVFGVFPILDMSEFETLPETADPLPHEWYVKIKNSMVDFNFSLYKNAVKLDFHSKASSFDSFKIYKVSRILFVLNGQEEIISVVFIDLKKDEFNSLLEGFHRNLSS